MGYNISEDEKMKTNYAEYIVKKKADGGIIMKRIGIIALCIAVFLAGCVLFLSVVKLPVAIVPLIIADMALTWYLWRFANVEYEYVVICGTVEFTKVYGERQRKSIEEVKISDFDKVAPYEKLRDEISKFDKDAVSYYCASVDSENLFAILMTENGKKRAILINVTKKTLDAIKYYKANAVDYGDVK